MYVELGKIVGVWGVKGWLKLHSFTRDRIEIADYPRWFLQAPGDKGNERIAFTVLNCREQGQGIVAQLDGLDDRNEALALRGYKIWVANEDLPALPQGEFYWQELIGLAVVYQQQEIGCVESLLETGANDVLVCKRNGDGGEFLIPYTDQTVLEVDLEAGTMTVDWDPSYLDDN